MSATRKFLRSAWRRQYAPGMFRRRDRLNGWRLFAGLPLRNGRAGKLAALVENFMAAKGGAC